MIDRIRARARTWLGVPSIATLSAEVSEQVARTLAKQTPPPTVDDDPENPANWLSLDYVHDRVFAQLEAQNQRWESADARLRLILGLIGVVFAITSNFAAARNASTVVLTAGASVELAYLPFWVGALLVAGMLLYFAAGFVAVAAYWPLTFYRPPDPVDLRNEYLTTDPRTTKLETLDTILDVWGAAVIIQLLLNSRAWSGI